VLGSPIDDPLFDPLPPLVGGAVLTAVPLLLATPVGAQVWGAGVSAGNLTGRDLSVSARVYFGDFEQQ
jgi:hypothetical protein